MVRVAFVLTQTDRFVPLHESMEMTNSFVKGVLLRAVWKFCAPQNGSYHLIVGSDNRSRFGHFG